MFSDTKLLVQPRFSHSRPNARRHQSLATLRFTACDAATDVQSGARLGKDMQLNPDPTSFHEGGGNAVVSRFQIFW